MTKTFAHRWPLLATVAALLMLTLPALAAGGKKANNGHGKVTAISATSITVTPKNGDAKTFTINDSTTLTLDGTTVKAADDASLMGTRARVKSDDGATATTITATSPKKKGTAPATPPAPATP